MSKHTCHGIFRQVDPGTCMYKLQHGIKAMYFSATTSFTLIQSLSWPLADACTNPQPFTKKCKEWGLNLNLKVELEYNFALLILVLFQLYMYEHTHAHIYHIKSIILRGAQA